MFEKKSILVIGDVMLDIYIRGGVKRISPEAPVAVFGAGAETEILGGAANVAANLNAAGQYVSIMTMLGKDSYGQKIMELFHLHGIDSRLADTWNKPTTTKTRFLAENNQQVFRVDKEDTAELSEEQTCEQLEKLSSVIEQFDLILVSDYCKGYITCNFLQGIISLADRYGIKVVVDVKEANPEKYKGAFLLKPNLKELNSLTGMPVSAYDEAVIASEYLRTETGCSYVLTTRGADGMLLVSDSGVKAFPSLGKNVFDVTGAGDTVIAYLAAGLANGLDIEKAVKISNYAAGIQVGKVGTSIVSEEEVEAALHIDSKAGQKHIFFLKDRTALLRQLKIWRTEGDILVTTNGCFDLIHCGHISLLQKAKSFGDRLIVLINSDNSVKRLKGENRPLNSDEARAEVLAALACVDAVAVFDPETDNELLSDEDLKAVPKQLRKAAQEAPMGILKQIGPDVHVKGGDYTAEQIPEAMFASQVRVVSYVKGYSTTSILNKSKE